LFAVSSVQEFIHFCVMNKLICDFWNTPTLKYNFIFPVSKCVKIPLQRMRYKYNTVKSGSLQYKSNRNRPHFFPFTKQFCFLHGFHFPPGHDVLTPLGLPLLLSTGPPNWQPAGRMRPSDQLSAARRDVLTYFNFLIRNVSKFVRNPAWRFSQFYHYKLWTQLNSHISGCSVKMYQPNGLISVL
jgi:hypothetical protein